MNEFDNQYSPVPVEAKPVVPVAARVLGYISLGLGISSLGTFFVGLPFSIAGLITAGIGRKKNHGNDTKPNRIGRILSIIGIPVSILWLVLYIVIIVTAMEGHPAYLPQTTKDFYFFLRTLCA